MVKNKSLVLKLWASFFVFGTVFSSLEWLLIGLEEPGPVALGGQYICCTLGVTIRVIINGALLVYAIGLWFRRAFAIWIGWFWAAFVVANFVGDLVVSDHSVSGMGYWGVLILAAAVVMIAGPAYILAKHRVELIQQGAT